jgi:hypothetical protein
LQSETRLLKSYGVDCIFKFDEWKSRRRNQCAGVLRAQIEAMKDKSCTGDGYAKLLLPDYVGAVHVLRCLQDLAARGESLDSMAQASRAARRNTQAGGAQAGQIRQKKTAAQGSGQIT